MADTKRREFSMLSKCSVQFTALFSDQALEQCIKDLKSVVIGLTQSHKFGSADSHCTLLLQNS